MLLFEDENSDDDEHRLASPVFNRPPFEGFKIITLPGSTVMSVDKPAGSSRLTPARQHDRIFSPGDRQNAIVVIHKRRVDFDCPKTLIDTMFAI